MPVIFDQPSNHHHYLLCPTCILTMKLQTFYLELSPAKRVLKYTQPMVNAVEKSEMLKRHDKEGGDLDVTCRTHVTIISHENQLVIQHQNSTMTSSSLV
ncbi:hypothetical protein HanPSC8_Chr03g0097721 [Helianthus annuus]|nr:hypothetical protein HanPSC8_Chr03g0097721 [Helianthus annuus]